MNDSPKPHRGEKYNRNQKMYELHAEGLSYYALAKKFRITDTAARKAVLSHIKKYKLPEIPFDIVERRKVQGAVQDGVQDGSGTERQTE